MLVYVDFFIVADTSIILEVCYSANSASRCISGVTPCSRRTTLQTGSEMTENILRESRSTEPRRKEEVSEPPQLNSSTTSSIGGRTRGRGTPRSKKRAESRRRQARRRVARRKVHRHSTRVFNLKPAVILLPPYEATSSSAHKLDPFIINVISTSTSTTATSDLDSWPEQPSTTNKTLVMPPRRFLLPPSPNQEETPLETIQVETPGNTHEKDSNLGTTTVFGFTPDYSQSAHTFFYSDYQQNQQNPPSTTYNDNLNSYSPTPHPQTQEAYTHQSYQLFNYSSSENPFAQLQRDYNDLQKAVEYREEPVNRTLDEVSISSYSTNEKSYYQDDWSPSPTPSFNGTILTYTESWNGSFFEERSLKNEFSKVRNSYDVLNNSLLAPEVASRGMKIVTSKKGMEMLKEFATFNNSRVYSNEPSYNSAIVNLETAETGDLRLQAYDNQILTYGKNLA